MREEAEMSSTGRIRVMVVDDHPIMRDGLRDALEASGRFEVVGLAGDGEEAVRTGRGAGTGGDRHGCDDARAWTGIDACREVMELLPDTRVLMLTASSEEDAVIEAIAAGATGYLQKYTRPEELVEAVWKMWLKGEGVAIPGKVGREVFAMVPLRSRARLPSGFGRADGGGTGDPDAVRQRHVVHRDCPSEGQQHCDRPELPLPHTGKLGVETKQELVIWAVRNGLLDDVVVGR